MKFYIENNVTEDLLAKVKIFTADPGSVMELVFGASVGGGYLLNMITILSGTEQVQHTFQTEAPAGYRQEVESREVTLPNGEKTVREVTKPGLKISAKVKDFMATVGNLVALKEKLYLEEKEGLCHVGVDGSARLQLDVLAADQMPAKIGFDAAKALLAMETAVSSLTDVLRIGSCMAVNEAEESRGLGNVVLAVDFAETDAAVYQGRARVYSSNGTAISKGECAVTIPAKDKCMLQRLTDFKAAAEKEFYMTALPKRAVKNLIALLSGQQQVQLWFTDRHVCARLGKSTVYTFAQGAKATEVVFFADQWQKAQNGFQLIVDAENLKGKVDLLNKLSAYKGADRMPIRMTATPESPVLVVETSGAGELGKVQVPILGKNLEAPLQVLFSGGKLAEVIGSLKKGNLSISCQVLTEDMRLPVMFANGDLKELGTSTAFLMPVANAKKQEPETEESEEASEE